MFPYYVLYSILQTKHVLEILFPVKLADCGLVGDFRYVILN